MLRRVLILTFPLALVACAAPEFKPLEFPPPVPLQDAPSGRAIVYLLRAPHERESVSVYFNSKRVAVLPPERYTAVVVQPGSYSVSSSVGSAESSQLTVAAGERRFLYTAVPTSSTSSLLFAPAGTGVVPLVLPVRAPAGARFWRECGEVDAQGLLSISKAVAPEPGAL